MHVLYTRLAAINTYVVRALEPLQPLQRLKPAATAPINPTATTNFGIPRLVARVGCGHNSVGTLGLLSTTIWHHETFRLHTRIAIQHSRHHNAHIIFYSDVFVGLNGNRTLAVKSQFC